MSFEKLNLRSVEGGGNQTETALVAGVRGLTFKSRLALLTVLGLFAGAVSGCPTDDDDSAASPDDDDTTIDDDDMTPSDDDDSGADDDDSADDDDTTNGVLCRLDEDLDGYGSNQFFLPLDGDCKDEGEVGAAGILDCDDENPDAFPGNDEDCEDSADNDCDGIPDEEESECQGGGDDDSAGDDDDDSADDDDDDSAGDDDDSAGDDDDSAGDDDDDSVVVPGDDDDVDDPSGGPVDGLVSPATGANLDGIGEDPNPTLALLGSETGLGSSSEQRVFNLAVDDGGSGNGVVVDVNYNAGESSVSSDGVDSFYDQDIAAVAASSSDPQELVGVPVIIHTEDGNGGTDVVTTLMAADSLSNGVFTVCTVTPDAVTTTEATEAVLDATDHFLDQAGHGGISNPLYVPYGRVLVDCSNFSGADVVTISNGGTLAVMGMRP